MLCPFSMQTTSPRVCKMEKCLAWYEGYNDYDDMPYGTCRLIPGALDYIAHDKKEHEKFLDHELEKMDKQMAEDAAKIADPKKSLQ